MKMMSKTTLAWLALLFGFITIAASNLVVTEKLPLANIDMTESGIYTLSEPSRKMLNDLDEPITLTLYYSKEIGNKVPSYALYVDRVRSVLRQYAALAKGKLKFQQIDPELFSDEEDMAMAAGLQGINIGSQQKGYFGLVGTNSTDDMKVIAFFDASREAFLEYDLTKLVMQLSNPARQKIGLIAGVPMTGGRDFQGRELPAWNVMKQIQDFYSVEPIKPSAESLPNGLDMLLIVAPAGLNEGMARAVDKFALSGKPVMVFADPFTELRQKAPMALAADDNFLKMLAGWGVDLDVQKVVGDLPFSRMVQYGHSGQQANYVAWIDYPQIMMDSKDPIFASVSQLIFATAGALRQTKGATTTFEPLLTTSDKAMLLDRKLFANPDPAAILAQYIAGDKAYNLIVRLRGKTTTEWSGAGQVNVLVVSDADMLYDSFYAERSQVMGKAVMVPRASNVDLLLNGLSDLSGGESLSGLRGRGVVTRHFTLLEDIERAAQEKYQARENLLNEKLKASQEKLRGIQGKAKQGQAVLSEDDKKTIMGVRDELITTRRDLREVKRALRENIDQVQFWVTSINILGVPLMIIFGAIIVGLVRRRRAKS